MIINRIKIKIVWCIVIIASILCFPAYAGSLNQLKLGWEGYIRNGNTRVALDHFEKAYQLDSSSIAIAGSYSQLLIQTGKYQAAADVLTVALKNCKWDKWCEPALADLEGIIEYIPSLDELANILQVRLDNVNLSWIEKSFITGLITKIHISNMEFNKAEKIYLENGYIKDWYYIGPFSNRNQQEFLKNQSIEETIDKIDIEKDWQDRGRILSWEKYSTPGNGRGDLGKIVYPGVESMSYVLCYVEAEEECDAVFAVEQSGGSAMWLNGELIYVDSVYVDNDSSLQRLIGLKLKKGVNQVVFKLAAGKDVLPRIRMRVLYGKVEQMNMPSSAKFVQLNKGKITAGASEEMSKKYLESDNMVAGAGKMPVLEQGESWGRCGNLWGALAEFEAMISDKSLTDSYEYALALMNMGYLINQYGFDSSEKGRERNFDMILINKYPDCPLFLNFAAYVQLDDNSKKILLEKSVKISPDEIAAREGLMYLQVAGGFYNKAWKSAESIASDEGENFSTNNIIASISERNGWDAEAYQYYTKALEHIYGSGWVYARCAGVSGSAAKAVSILEKGKSRVFDRDLGESLGGWLYKMGRYEEAENVYSDLLRIYKYSEEYWDSYAACSLAQGKHQLAIDRLQQGLYWMPQSPFLKEQIGRLLLRIGKRDEGVEYLKQALALQKDNPDLVAYIAELSSDKKEFYIEDAVDFEILQGKDIKAADYPQFDRIRLLDQNYIKVAENGSAQRMVRKIVKVLRNSAAKEVSNEAVFYDSSRQKIDVKHARVIQPDGKINENPVIEDMHYNTGFDQGGIYNSAQVKSIKLASVKEGSIIDIMYTIEDTDANMYHDEFSDIKYIGEVEPTLKFIYTLAIPETMDVKQYTRGIDKELLRKSGDGKVTKLRLELDNVPGIEVEPMMPPLGDIKPFLVVSTFKDWADLARWADGLFAPEMVLPDDIKNEVKGIVANAETRDERIEAIYNYVTKNIRYVSISYGRFGYAPHKAERTFRSGYGDCKDTAVLLCAMLREVGIESYPTLVRTRDMGELLSELPGPQFFNHSIAYIPAAGEGQQHYWLDGTTDFFSLGMIPAMDRGTKSLIIRSEGGLKEIDGFEPSQEVQTSRFKMVLNKDGSGQITGKEIYQGRSSISLKYTMEKPEAFYSMLKGFFNKRFSGVEVSRLGNGVSEEEEKGWFEYSVFARKMAIEDNAYLKVLPWIFPVNIDGIAVLKTRKYDLEIGNPQILEIEAEIELKDNMKILAALEDVDEEIPAVKYTRYSENTPTGIKVTSRIIIRKSRVPVEEYEEFKSFINMIMARHKEWLFVSK